MPIGAILSLLAALAWAIGLTLFRIPLRHRGADEVNFFKCSLGTLLFWLVALSLAPADPLGGLRSHQVLFLALSGIIGMSLGDSFLFMAVSRLGATRALMLHATNPVMATTLAWVLLSERLSFLEICGIALAVSGTALVVADRGSGMRVLTVSAWRLGIPAGLLAAVGQAAGLVLVRAELGAEPSPALLIPACAVRLSAGAGGLLLWTVLRRPARVLPLFASASAWRQMGLATFIGTFTGILLMIGGVMYARAGVASALTSMTPIFLMLIGFAFLRERYGPLSCLGVLAGVGGIVLLM